MQQTLVVGDIQGCYSGLRRLLDKAGFDPQRDRLVAVGDLVARGKESLETIQYLRQLGNQFCAVLGNHDLHFLAITQGIKKAKKNDYLTPLLDAPDLPDIIQWLRQLPLALRVSPQHTVVHAGLYPEWSTDTLLARSDEVSTVLKSDDWVTLLSTMYGSEPEKWRDKLKGEARHRFIVNACTRMRFIKKGNQLEFATKAGPKDAPAALTPWFNVPNSHLKPDEKVIFGHWAAMLGKFDNSPFIGLDTGYVWGNSMTALRLEDGLQLAVAAKN